MSRLSNIGLKFTKGKKAKNLLDRIIFFVSLKLILFFFIKYKAIRVADH